MTVVVRALSCLQVVWDLTASRLWRLTTRGPCHLRVFQASNYTHCSVLRRLLTDVLMWSASVFASMDHFPACFRHSLAVITKYLSGLIVSLLTLCAASLFSSSVRCTKGANVGVILQHFLDLQ